MKKLFFIVLVISASFSAFSQSTVSGNLKYQDFKIGLSGYTGQSQLLPVRHLKIRAVTGTGAQMGFGYSDASGNYSINLTANNSVTQNVFLIASTEGDVANGFPIYVVDTLSNGHTTNLTNLPFIAAYIDTVSNYQPNTQAQAGNAVIYAKSSVSVAQAFNIFDCGVDAFKWAASAEARNKPAVQSELLIYEWSGTRQIEGAYYTNHTIRMGTPAFTDYPSSGYADMVVFHETGHYLDDVMINYVSTNPGGSHTLGDNFQNPNLSWGEGWPTFIAGAILKWKLSNSEPISPQSPAMYSDMGNPPSWPPAAGTALNFSYDFEEGFGGQRGSANETNITSALWDVVDDAAVADFSQGTDDDNLTKPMSDLWKVFTSFAALNKDITIDDFWKQWFALNLGSEAEMKTSFAELNLLPYHTDSFEPQSNTKQTAPLIPAQDSRVTGANNGVVIYEIEPGAYDAVEIMNTTASPINISGWKLQTARNPYSNVLNPTTSYTIPGGVTIPANSIITIYEGGSSSDNTATTLNTGTNIHWGHEADGACSLLDASNNGVDFVKWGGNTNLPVPAGTSFTGTLNSPVLPDNLQRNSTGTDSNAASDFSEKSPTLGLPNIDLVTLSNTFFAENDIDYFAVKGSAGNTFNIVANNFFSATLPMISIEDQFGNQISQLSAESSEETLILELTLPDTNLYFVKFSNQAQSTLYGEYSLSVLQVKDQNFAPFKPVNLTYKTGNGITLSWTNGSSYDSVSVYKNDFRVGSTTENTWTDMSLGNKEVAKFGVLSWKDNVPSNSPAEIIVINAAALDKYSNFFETDNEILLWATQLDWAPETGTGINSSSAMTDSPLLDYEPDTESRIELNVPVLVTTDNKLLFSHVALIEPGDQDGDWDWGKVEVRKKGSSVWIDATSLISGAIASIEGNGKIIDGRMYESWMQELEDFTYNIPPLYKNESIKLSSIPGIAVNDTIFISFHMFTDGFVEYDGWYIDNVGITNGSVVVGIMDQETTVSAFRLFEPYPNPFNPSTTIRFTASSAERVTVNVYNVLGQKIQTLFDGTAEQNKNYTLTWNGMNSFSQPVASGLYIFELTQGSLRQTKKALLIK